MKRVRAGDPANYPGPDAQILIASTGRGVVAPILVNLDDHSRVFVAREKYLLENPDAWLPQVKAQPTIYFAASPSVRQFLRAEGLRLVGHPTFYQYGAVMILPLEDTADPQG